MCPFSHWRRAEADETLEAYVTKRTMWARKYPKVARVALNELIIGVGNRFDDTHTLADAQRRVQAVAAVDPKQYGSGFVLWLFLQFGVPILLKLVKAWWDSRHKGR